MYFRKVLTSVINVVLLVSFDVAINCCYSFASCFVGLPEITVKKHKVRGGIVSEPFPAVYSFEQISICCLVTQMQYANFLA